jgi:outer membrane immunogenic protein
MAALSAVFMAAPAVAADVAPPPPEAYNWTGFHIGVGGGGNFAFANEDPDAFIGGDCYECYWQYGQHSGDLGKAGFFGTVEGGFDYQLGSNFVAGILANYDFGKEKMKNKSNAEVYFNFGGPPIFTEDGSFQTEYEVGDSWAIGGRIGFLPMENALIYVLGGYTEAEVKAESQMGTNGLFPYFDYHTSNRDWLDGWFVGGGIEALVWDNISLKAEYRYSDYGNIKNNNFEEPEAEFVLFNDQKADITVHSVRAVLSYRFGLF